MTGRHKQFCKPGSVLTIIYLDLILLLDSSERIFHSLARALLTIKNFPFLAPGGVYPHIRHRICRWGSNPNFSFFLAEALVSVALFPWFFSSRIFPGGNTSTNYIRWPLAITMLLRCPDFPISTEVKNDCPNYLSLIIFYNKKSQTSNFGFKNLVFE